VEMPHSKALKAGVGKRI